MKAEYSGPAKEQAENPQAKAARLSRFGITQGQADGFQIAGFLASIGIPLCILISHDDWLHAHDILIGKFHGNLLGLFVAAALFIGSYAVITLLMTIAWLFIRQPAGKQE